jgi:phosphoribosylformylglycinamidine synthase
VTYGAPFVSGKDSLNNEYIDPNGVKTPIPPTLLISALGCVPDVRKAVTMDLKTLGNRLYVVGETRAELGGSALFQLYGRLGNSVPAPVPSSIEAMRALHQAMRKGWVRACHDCSEGGLAIAAAEMAFAGGIGLEVHLSNLPRDGEVDDIAALFSESSGRFLVEVSESDAQAFEDAMHGVPCAHIGTSRGGSLRVVGLEGGHVIDVTLEALKTAWQGGSIDFR